MKLVEGSPGEAVAENGEPWILCGNRWRPASDGVEPPCDAPPILLGEGPFGFRPLQSHDQTEITFARDLFELKVNGRVWRGSWKLLVETPRGRMYVRFW